MSFGEALGRLVFAFATDPWLSRFLRVGAWIAWTEFGVKITW